MDIQSQHTNSYSLGTPEKSYIRNLRLSSSNILNELTSLLENGHVRLGIYLYNKHNSESENLPNHIQDIIAAIPLTTPLNEFSYWIQLKVIPNLTKNQLICLEKSIINRAKSIEAISNYHDAYATTKLITHSPIFACRLGIPTKISTIANAKIRSQQEFSQYFPSEEFLSFQSKLKLLVDMKEKYKLSLSLSNNFLDDDFSIASEMLKRAKNGEELSERILQLKEYVKERHLDLDQVLLSHLYYIIEQMEYTSNLEDQIAIAIQNIQDIELKARGTVDLLPHSKKPIPPIFVEILEQSLAFPTCYKSQLLTQKGLVDFWQINAKYSEHDIIVRDRFQTSAFFLYVLKSGDSSALQDGLKISQVFDWLNSEDAYSEYIFELICRNMEDKIPEILKGIKDEKERIKTVETVYWRCVAIVEAQFSESFPWSSEFYNLGIRGVIFLGEYISRSDKKSWKDWNKSQACALQIKKLASEFKIHLTLTEFADENIRISVLIKCLIPYLKSLSNKNDENNVFEKSSGRRKRKRIDGETPSKRLQQKCLSLSSLYYLTDLLQLSRNTFQMQAAIQASKLGNFMLSLSYLQELIQNSPSKYILSAIKEVSLNLIQNCTETSIPAMILPYIRWALSKCPPEEISDFLQLSTDIERAGWIYQQTESEDKENRNVFNEEQMFLDTKEVIPLVRNYIQTRSSHKEAGTKQLFDVLHRSGCLVLATNLLLESPELIKDQSVEEIASVLLNKVLSSREIDYSLALGITLSMGHDKSFEYLNRSLPQRNNEYSKTQMICQLGQDSAILWRDHDQAGNWKNHEAASRWTHTLNLLKIPFDKTILNGREQSLIELFPQILHKTEDLDMCLELCRTYNIDESHAFLAYIEFQLLNPILNNKIKEHLDLDPEELSEYINESPFDESYKDKVVAAAYDIKPEELLDHLKDRILPRVVHLDYPRILFIFSYLVNLDRNQQQFKKYYATIEILSQYRRVTQPSHEERSTIIENARGVTKEVQKVYSAMNYIYFSADLFLTDPKSILNEELSLSTLDTLIKFASTLSLDEDWFRVRAIENMFQKHTHSYSDNNRCHYCPQFSEIKQTISQIKAYKTKCDLYEKIAKHYPLSEDFLALKQAHLKVLRSWYEWCENNNNQALLVKTKNAIEINEGKLSVYSTRFELKKYGLEAEFSAVIDNPKELIIALYFRLVPRVYNRLESFKKADLDYLIQSISNRFQIDLVQLKYELLYQWLNEEPKESDENIGKKRIGAYSLTHYCADNADLLNELRIEYLARAIDRNWIFKTFLNYGANPKNSKLSFKTIARAVTMLLKLFSMEELDDYKHLFPTEDIKLYLQHLYYMADLEVLKIPYDLQTLLKCDKLTLCKSLYKQHSSEYRTIQLIAGICMDYKLKDAKLWENLLEALLKFKAYLVLLYILEWLGSEGIYRSISSDSADIIIGKSCEEMIYFLNEKGAKLDIPEEQIGRVVDICIDLEINENSIKKIIECLVEIKCNKWINYAARLADFYGIEVSAYFYAKLMECDEETFCGVEINTLQDGIMKIPNKCGMIGFISSNSQLFEEFLNSLSLDSYSLLIQFLYNENKDDKISKAYQIYSSKNAIFPTESAFVNYFLGNQL
ncbi:unnamed protein product [Blepharisma stoltei]|uniref:Uncharacterized protein n=1 Tax=Blepharisma stoltei TaxID=1481888 RepID=A0AAU9IS84_9CILI|nr:unnamed protein product [Blepharisma stoltei]